MKVITITENNMRDVYGRLKKFFYNNNRTGFEEWHNFDCGFKKHISPEIYIGEDRIRNVNTYPSPNAIKYQETGTVAGINYSYIVLNFTASEGDSLRCGDKIAFCGNRIIYRTKCVWGDYNYIYSVFQALPMSKTEQDNKRLWAEREMKMFESDYYADCYDL